MNKAETTNKTRDPKSIALLLLCAIIWGSSFVAQVKSRSMTPFAYNGTRYILGTLTVAIVALIFERKNKDHEKLKITLKGGIISGTVLFIASNLQQLGIYYGTQAGKAGFFTGIYTVLVPIMAFAFFRKRTNYLTWIGVAFAVAGLYMLCMTNEKTLSFSFADALVLIGALFWSLHIITIDYFTEKGVSPLKYSTTQFFTCAVLSLACAFIFEDVSFADAWATKAEILYGGILSVGVAYTLQILGQRGVEPTLSAIILSTESVFSVIGGALILREHLAFPFGYLGCAAMFAAIVISQLQPKNIKKHHKLNPVQRRMYEKKQKE